MQQRKIDLVRRSDEVGQLWWLMTAGIEPGSRWCSADRAAGVRRFRGGCTGI